MPDLLLVCEYCGDVDEFMIPKIVIDDGIYVGTVYVCDNCEDKFDKDTDYKYNPYY